MTSPDQQAADLIAASGMTREQVEALAAAWRANPDAATRRRYEPPAPTCGTCGQPATHQASRPATDDETAAHWDGLEQHIRASGTPDYVQDRSEPVVIAEHRCDDHPHPMYQAAMDAAKTGGASHAEAVKALNSVVSAFSAEQVEQLAEALRVIGGDR